MEWDPQSAMYSDQVVSKGSFGAIPLFAGTFLIMLISMTVAAPVGLFAAIYLSEYASPTSRSFIKPLLEILAGVPTVVYGFFAALASTPSAPRSSAAPSTTWASTWAKSRTRWPWWRAS
jgi:phosphate transport system permease protein